MPRITTQKQLRKEFWETFPYLRESRRKITDYDRTDARVAWWNWLNSMRKGGHISPELAARATLAGRGDIASECDAHEVSKGGECLQCGSVAEPPETPASKAGHTPGPWIVNGPNNIYAEAMPTERRANGEPIPPPPCCVARPIEGHGVTQGQFFANARLIAAAPAMFKALEQIQIWTTGDHGYKCEAIDKIVSDAIAKAKGETK